MSMYILNGLRGGKFYIVAMKEYATHTVVQSFAGYLSEARSMVELLC